MKRKIFGWMFEDVWNGLVCFSVVMLKNAFRAPLTITVHLCFDEKTLMFLILDEKSWQYFVWNFLKNELWNFEYKNTHWHRFSHALYSVSRHRDGWPTDCQSAHRQVTVTFPTHICKIVTKAEWMAYLFELWNHVWVSCELTRKSCIIN